MKRSRSPASTNPSTWRRRMRTSAVADQSWERDMQLVTAVIKPHKWEDVREALAAVGISGMTVMEATGHGHQKGHPEVSRGAEYAVTPLPTIRLEAAGEAHIYDTCGPAISAAHTHVDGKPV